MKKEDPKMSKYVITNHIPNITFRSRIYCLFFLLICIIPAGADAARELPPARVGEVYEYVVDYTGLVEPVYAHWDRLPDWLEADGHVLKGVPKEPVRDPQRFSLRLRGQMGRVLAGDFSLRILPAVRPLQLEKKQLPPLPQNERMNISLSAGGGEGNLHWDARWRKKIPGLEIEINETEGSCRLVGEPERDGKFQLHITVSDETGASDSYEFEGAVRPFAVPLHIVEPNLPEATCNAPFYSRLIAEGGRPPYQWDIRWTTLSPPGITTNSDGTITGEPAKLGQFPFTVKVRDSLGAERQETSTLRVEPPACQPFIVKTELPEVIVGQSFTATLSCEGLKGDAEWTISGGPSWLNWDVSGNVACRLSGIPDTEGTWHINAKVSVTCPSKTTSGVITEEVATDSREFVLTVLPEDIEPLRIIELQPPVAVENLPYQFLFTAKGGHAPVNFTFTGNLPEMLKTDREGLIRTDKMSTSGWFPFSVLAESEDGQKKRFDTALSVIPADAPPSLDMSDTTQFNVLYLRKSHIPLSVKGGIPPYTIDFEPTRGLNLWSSGNGADIAVRLKNPWGARAAVNVTDSLGHTVTGSIIIRPVVPLEYFFPVLLIILLIWQYRKNCKNEDSL